MVRHYSEVADVVVILISPISKVTDDGIEISREESKQIWQVYLNSVGLDSNNVIIARSPFNSPVQSSYELVAGNIDGFIPAAGDLIIPGASTKPDPKSGLSDTSRFRKFHLIPKEMRAPGVLTADVEDYAFTPSKLSGVAVSATDFRTALDSGNIEAIISFIPDGVSPETILDIVQDAEPEQKKTLTMESLYSLVEEILDNKLNEVSSEKQRKWACAQIDSPRELTVKQAKEMCNSEISETVQLEEGLQSLKRVVKGIGSLGNIAKSFLRFLKSAKSEEELLKLHQEMSEQNSWYPSYLDPLTQQQEINDTLEILYDYSKRGRTPNLCGTDNGECYDSELLDLWWRNNVGKDIGTSKQQNYIKQMIDIETGKTKVKGWDDPEYRLAAMLEEEDINETSVAAGAAGSPGANKGPWIGLEKEKDREDLTIAGR